ncbi:MAG: hypothetical protein AAGC47_05130 [Bacteroidota bacterium]
MKAVRIIILFGLLLVTLACNHEEVDTPNKTFFKVFNSEIEYIARQVLQKVDGTILVLAIANEEIGQSAFFGTRRSELLVYTASGDFVKELILPEEVHAAHGMVLLKSDAVLVFGYDKEARSSTVGLVRIGNSLEVDLVSTFNNNMGVGEITTGLDFNQIKATVFENGNIVLSLVQFSPNVFSFAGYYTRLVIFDESLNILNSAFYNGDPSERPFPIRSTRPSRVQELANRNIAYPVIQRINQEEQRALLIEIDFNTLDSVSSFDLNPLADIVSSKFVISPSGDAYFPGISFGSDEPPASSYRIRNLETIELYQDFSAYAMQDDDVVELNLSGLPSLIGVVDVAGTSDGGAVFLGICNMLESTNLVSNSRMFIAKISPDQSVDWIETISTGRPIYPGSIIQVADGFLISSTGISTQNQFQINLIKTDKNGKIN